ncbi:hypothetical protein ACPC54_03085 [Kitasatospora sp. NPDC094028]
MLVDALCLVPEIVSLWFVDRFDGQSFRLVHIIVRAVSACGDAYNAPAIRRAVCLRTVEVRCRKVGFELQMIHARDGARSRFSPRNREVRKHASRVRKRLFQLESELDANPKEALRSLAEALAIVAENYSAGNTRSLLPASELPAESNLLQDERLRVIGAVTSAAAAVWWISAHLSGVAQAFSIAMAPALAFVLFFGIDRGLSLFTRLKSGSDQPAASSPSTSPETATEETSAETRSPAT